MRAMCAITVGQSFKNVPNDKSFKNVPNDYIDVLATPASGPHLRHGDAKRKGADLLVAPLKLNVRLSKCGPRSVEPLRGS